MRNAIDRVTVHSIYHFLFLTALVFVSQSESLTLTMGEWSICLFKAKMCLFKAKRCLFKAKICVVQPY
jgi:hypothetical protein